MKSKRPVNDITQVFFVISEQPLLNDNEITNVHEKKNKKRNKQTSSYRFLFMQSQQNLSHKKN